MDTSHLYSLEDKTKDIQKKKLLILICLLTLFFVVAAGFAPSFLKWVGFYSSFKIYVKNGKMMIPCNNTDKIIDVQSVVGFTEVSESAGGSSCFHYQGLCYDGWQFQGVWNEYVYKHLQLNIVKDVQFYI